MSSLDNVLKTNESNINSIKKKAGENDITTDWSYFGLK